MYVIQFDKRGPIAFPNYSFAIIRKISSQIILFLLCPNITSIVLFYPGRMLLALQVRSSFLSDWIISAAFIKLLYDIKTDGLITFDADKCS